MLPFRCEGKRALSDVWNAWNVSLPCTDLARTVRCDGVTGTVTVMADPGARDETGLSQSVSQSVSVRE